MNREKANKYRPKSAGGPVRAERPLPDPFDGWTLEDLGLRPMGRDAAPNPRRDIGQA